MEPGGRQPRRYADRVRSDTLTWSVESGSARVGVPGSEDPIRRLPWLPVQDEMGTRAGVEKDG